MERRNIVKKRTGKMVASSPLVRCMREHIFECYMELLYEFNPGDKHQNVVLTTTCSVCSNFCFFVIFEKLENGKIEKQRAAKMVSSNHLVRCMVGSLSGQTKWNYSMSLTSQLVYSHMDFCEEASKVNLRPIMLRTNSICRRLPAIV